MKNTRCDLRLYRFGDAEITVDRNIVKNRKALFFIIHVDSLYRLHQQLSERKWVDVPPEDFKGSLKRSLKSLNIYQALA